MVRTASKRPADKDGGYGATLRVAESFEVSPATAARDLAIVRRMLEEFENLFEREFQPSRDEVVWFWDYSS